MKEYLITGATGFLGKYIIRECGNDNSITVGRNPSNNIVWDISKSYDKASLKAKVIVHVAGQAHVYPKTTEEREKFFKINLDGTMNLLNALDTEVIEQFIFISTVAVYGVETGNQILENHPLNADTPYGISKVKAEKAIQKWGIENNVKILILRLPLIVGDNPPGNLGKMISSILKGRYLSINNGNAKRSAVLASDVSELIVKGREFEGVYNLTDGCDPTFRDFEKRICGQLGKSIPLSIPLPIAKLMGKVGGLIPGFPLNSAFVNKMTLDFTVSCEKAKTEINWRPNSAINHLNIIE